MERKRHADVRRKIGKRVMSMQICPENCHWPDSYNSFWPEEPTRGKLDERYYLWRLNHDARPSPHFFVTWANHVFDIDPSRPLTRHVFREALEKLDTGSGGPYLCPHIRIDDGQLLIPLQPGFCCCFTDKLEPGYKVNQHRHSWGAQNVCRFRTEASANLDKTVTLGSYLGGFLHVYSCYECKTYYFWRRRQNTIHLERFSGVYAKIAWSDDWIRKLDPHSWNITSDDETRHVYWCPNTDCRTNYRWSALYRRLGLYDRASK
ncbi:hypothetical protein SEPCBS119000_002446 [Sporothrix epigloea]|uniref:Uncharacterized protein n=1 Tax=Sporothrix epigloea TaxID=1892477 RepID=A0ABP0DKA5_9PEZI